MGVSVFLGVNNAANLNIAGQAIGDLIAADTTTSFARLPDVAVGQVITSGGVGAAPAYSATPTITGIKPVADSSTAITIANAAGTGKIVVDTTSGRFAIGKATAPTTTLDVLEAANATTGGQLTNTTSGVAAATACQFAAGTTTGGIYAQSQGFTTSGRFVQSHGLVDFAYLDLSSSGSNPIDFWSNGAKIASLSSTVLNLISQALQYNGNALASGTVAPASPTGTTSTTLVMAGLAGSITTRTGKVVFTMSGYMLDTSANDGTKCQISYGTGTAPVNGAALTGTQVGPVVQYNASTLAASASAPYAATWIVTGLSAGTVYWFDTAFAAITGGTGTLLQATMTAFDIP